MLNLLVLNIIENLRKLNNKIKVRGIHKGKNNKITYSYALNVYHIKKIQHSKAKMYLDNKKRYKSE